MIEVKIKQEEEVRSVSLNQDEVVIGRYNEKKEVHIDLSPDDSVSRIHARIWKNDGILYLEDLGSSGGTYVNGLAITEIVSLEPDTEVFIGGQSLIFSAGNAPSGCIEEGIHVELLTGGKTNLSVFNLEEIFIGRSHPEHEVHIDLSQDLNVSRVHARVWRTREICWIEDLKSTHGTLVNGEMLDGARVIGPEDRVQIGDAQIKIHYHQGQSEANETLTGYETSKLPASGEKTEGVFEEMDSYPVYKEDSYRYFLPEKRNKSDLENVFQSRKSPMGRIRSTHEVSLEKPFQDDEEGSNDFLKVLPDLITRVNGMSDAKMIADWFVNSVSKWVPEAERASLYMIDKEAGRIKLMAHKPALKPIISDILVHRALEVGRAFAWQQVGKEESVRRISANAGIYVPLIAQGNEVGLICAENTSSDGNFSSCRLRRLVLVGQLISLALLQYCKRR